jgi:hypothetical protein
LGLLSFFILWLAKAKGYFVLPFEKQAAFGPSLISLGIFFSIYLVVSLLFGPLLMYLFHFAYAKEHPGFSLPIAAAGGIQLVVIGCIFLLFFLYARSEDPILFKKIWKNKSAPNALPIRYDIAMGILTWFIAFPLVALIGEISDMLLYVFCGLQNYEQVAVRYLKSNLVSLETMIIPLFIILFAAPAIEEFLFRGLLQSFFKKHMEIKKAIALSSLCFALFHFSPSQGIGNISLLVSLFTFALFLGFIYERQSSLFASLATHITFNTFSTVRILFFPE